MRKHGRFGPIEWARAARPRPGEDVCGDVGVAIAAGDCALFGVIDGLGHGKQAAEPARRAAAVLTDNPAEPLDVLMVLCHRALVDTRGATISLAQIGWDGRNELSWIGVGNVDAWLIEAAPGGPIARAVIPQLPGIVGYQLPSPLHPLQLSLRPGDLLVMTSDGIRGDFLDVIDLSKPAETLVAELLESRAKDSDDAIVLAARHRGVA